jgi:uncharacterized protein DUF4920
MKLVIAAAIAALLVPVAADTKLGSGVSLTDTTKIEAIVATPADYVGKTIKVEGVATAVCAHMGCWMAVATSDDPSAATIRLKVDDGVIVFPVTAKGKRVSAQGVFERVGGGDARDAAAEHAHVDAAASQQYQLKATGAVIRE